MFHPVSKPEILEALETNARLIVEFFSGLPDPRFFDGDLDHWAPANHLVHLTQTSRSMGPALSSSALPLHPTGRSRNYAEVRDAATASVAATSKDRLREMGRRAVIPPGLGRADLVKAFSSASEELRSAAAEWTEDALDRHALRHPLMGQLTVREMLFFFVVHERHHLKLVRTRVEELRG
jgi:hypothetical protein